MGARGPAPKRKEDLNGHRSRDELAGDHVVGISLSHATAAKAKQPAGKSAWSPDAKRIWKGAGDSAQRAVYEETDWAMLRSTMDEITQYQANEKRNSQHLAAIMGVVEDTLLLEGHRRRRGIETVKRTPALKPPRAGKDWHEDSKKLLAAMGRSPQASCYEPSDWAVAFFLLGELSTYKLAPFRSGQMLSTINSGLAGLLLTEGDRKRALMETTTGAPAQGPTTSAGQLEATRWLTVIQGGVTSDRDAG